MEKSLTKKNDQSMSYKDTETNGANFESQYQ